MSVRLISPAAAAQRLAAEPNAVLVDVRLPAEHRRLHAGPAKSVPLEAVTNDPSLQTAAGPVFLICQTGGRSAKAYEALAGKGLSDLYSVEGGTAAWEAVGLAVVRGAGMISIERQVRIGAGMLVLVGTLLGLFVHRGFLGIPLFVGGGLTFAGVTDWCGMGLLLARMPWNRTA